MTTKSTAQDTSTAEPMKAMSQLQEAGLGNMMGMGTAWLKTMSSMQAEVADFIATRIKEDVKTQHEILQCKDASDLQDIQSRFIQKAIDQYQAETGKLVEIGAKAFGPTSDDA